MSNKPSRKPGSSLAFNRKALHDFEVLEKFEAGLELRGTEVKVAREAHAELRGSFAGVEHGELWLRNLNIPAYEFGNRFNHEPTRPRRLLMHRREILRIQSQLEQKGLALVPLRLYLKRGVVKVELALCRGKTHRDKRETLRRKDAEMESRRAMARHWTG